ncbi:MAG: hypothetical protein KIS87_11870, partial [Phycisphaeraceae bacterium]|nr:hypothetical protein [Phycisphaeraceae bacterium]
GGSRPPAKPPSTGALDPIKLLKKYAWLLAASVVVGAALGVGSFFILRIVAPIFRPAVLFEALPVQDRIDQVIGMSTTREEEMERFMLTQAAYMKSETVMHAVVNDPRLRSQAPNWSKKFEKSGRFQAAEAADWLVDKTRARTIPGTYIIELSVGWRNPRDAHALVGLVRETYLRVLNDQRNMLGVPQRDAIERNIRDMDTRIKALQDARDLRIRTEQIDSLDERTNEASLALANVVNQLTTLRLSIQAVQVQLKSYQDILNAPGPIAYSDDLREAVENDPLIRGILQQITSLETNQAAMLQRGITPEHRNYQAVQSMIDSWKQSLESEREKLLRQRFDGIVESLVKGNSQLRAQEADLLAQREIYVKRLNDLTRLKVEMVNVEQQVQSLINSRSDLQTSLEALRQMDPLASAARIKVAQMERIPDKPAFPNIIIMVPAGILLMLFATGGTVFLREMLDQRVKGPSDVTIIPKTTLLGILPDASEDPDQPKSIATVFRDHPRSVTAESVRQLRAPLAKKLKQTGHRTIMVMAGMPGSGATAVATNLGLAFSASGQRVLVIDANFRRPGVHRALGLQESPGLADVLAGDGTLAGTVQAVSETLHVLTAGTAAKRAFETLSTDAMTGVFDAARQQGYDLVLIDVPPAIVSSDGMAIANRCDATMLVVRALNEKRGMVARLRNQLSESKSEFLGVVINGVRSAAGGYMRKNIKATHEYQNTAT